MTIRSKIFMAALLIRALPTVICASRACAQETVWTTIIPKVFPGFVYTWRLKPGGTYSEDGRDTATGKAVQPRLSGHWRVTGRRMVLKQDGIGYVFDGNFIGDEYLGVLYLDGKRFARFCAIKGEAPPQTCADISV
jgi:hypothetical protein